MSYEGRVTLAEAVQDTAPERVTPSKGKETLGKWRALTRTTVRALTRVAV